MLQHVFIPILPKSLLDYLLAPMPYVIGIDRSHAADLDRMSFSMNEVRQLDKQAGRGDDTSLTCRSDRR